MRKWIMLGVLLVVMSLPAKADDIPQYQVIRNIERNDVTIPGNLSEYFAFNPSGLQIAAAGSETTINIWDIETGEVIHTFDFASTAVSWSPDGRFIATGSNYDSVMSVWNVEIGTLKYELDRYSGRHSFWSPDGNRFATDGMRIFDAETGDLLVELSSNWSIPYAVYWSPNGTMIATPGGWEGLYLNIWSIEGERLDTYWAGISAAWSPDSTRLATTGQVRDVESGLPVTIIPDMEYQITWHPDGKWLTSTDDNEQVLLWDAETGELVTVWNFEGCSIRGFVWSNDGRRFALNCLQANSDQRNDLIIAELIR